MDVFARRSQSHGRRIVAALLELGFSLTPADPAEVVRGKDFVPIGSGRFEFDRVFAPDGIESFDAAPRSAERVENFPVMALSEIIASKRAAGRKRDLAEMELAAQGPALSWIDLILERHADVAKLAEPELFLAPLAHRLGVRDEIQRLPELFLETGYPVAKNVEVFPAHELGNGIPDAT